MATFRWSVHQQQAAASRLAMLASLVAWGSVAATAAVREASRSCDDNEAPSGGDGEASLLQVLRRAHPTSKRPSMTGGRRPGRRQCYPVHEGSQCSPEVAALLAEERLKSVGWWNLPAQPEGAAASDSLTPFNRFEGLPEKVWQFVEEATFATARAEEAVRLMLEATEVSSLVEHVPEPLRGVFWMRGNGVVEELTALQFGRWFEEESTYVQAVAPFSWAWADGKPDDAPLKRAPLGRTQYTNENAAIRAALMSSGAPATSFKFSTCPTYASCYGQDVLGNMSFAYMQIHDQGRVEINSPVSNRFMPLNLPGLEKASVTSTFTLELSPHAPGDEWRRVCKWGTGQEGCAAMEAGSFDLVRLVDGLGQAVGNNLEEFIDYMGDVPLVLWTGFKSPAARARVCEEMRRKADS